MLKYTRQIESLLCQSDTNSDNFSIPGLILISKNLLNSHGICVAKRENIKTTTVCYEEKNMDKQ